MTSQFYHLDMVKINNGEDRLISVASHGFTVLKYLKKEGVIDTLGGKAVRKHYPEMVTQSLILFDGTNYYVAAIWVDLQKTWKTSLDLYKIKAKGDPNLSKGSITGLKYLDRLSKIYLCGRLRSHK